MGFFTTEYLPEVHQEKIGELPELPKFELPDILTPTLAKYQEVMQKKYTPITALSNALLGEDVHNFFGDSLTIKETDYPELQESKKQLREKYMSTMSHMFDIANTFVDRLQSIEGNFGIFLRQMTGINEQVRQNVQDINNISPSTGTGKRQPDKEPMLTNMFTQLSDIRQLFQEKITRAYEKEKQDLQARLGEENQNSSYGLWEKAYLNRAYADRLLENDYDVLTKHSGVILDRAMQAMELQAKPMLMQMSYMQTALSANLEQQKTLEAERQANRNYDLQRQQIEQQLGLQQKAEILKGLEAQEKLNLSRQELASQQIQQQNINLLERERGINLRSLEQGKLNLEGEIERARNKQFYSNLEFQKAKQQQDAMLQKTQINNEAEYRKWQTRYTPKPPSFGAQLLGNTIGTVVGVGAGALLGNYLPTGISKIGSFLKGGK